MVSMAETCNMFIMMIIITYLLQMSCYSVAVVLTLAQIKQRSIKIHKPNSTIQKHITNNRQHSKYRYCTHITKTMMHTNTHILQNKLKQPQLMLHTKWNGGLIKFVVAHGKSMSVLIWYTATG
jgi:hypothetical protein